MSYLNVLLPIITAIIGSYLTYFFTNISKRKEAIMDKKRTFYLKFIELNAKWDYMDRRNTSSASEVELELGVCQESIILYGNKEVVEANSKLNNELYEFIKGKCNNNPTSEDYFNQYNDDSNIEEFYNRKESRTLYKNLIVAMRNDIGLKDKNIKDDDYYQCIDYYIFKQN
jgi:hypothetical protein